LQYLDRRLEELVAREDQIWACVQQLGACAAQSGFQCAPDKKHMFKDRSSILSKMGREMSDEEFLKE